VTASEPSIPKESKIILVTRRTRSGERSKEYILVLLQLPDDDGMQSIMLASINALQIGSDCPIFECIGVSQLSEALSLELFLECMIEHAGMLLQENHDLHRNDCALQVALMHAHDEGAQSAVEAMQAMHVILENDIDIGATQTLNDMVDVLHRYIAPTISKDVETNNLLVVTCAVPELLPALHEVFEHMEVELAQVSALIKQQPGQTASETVKSIKDYYKEHNCAYPDDIYTSKILSFASAHFEADQARFMFVELKIVNVAKHCITMSDVELEVVKLTRC
jgi:hypothetical protein